MNILILSASTGGGHLTASFALESYIRENEQNFNVEVVDCFKYISPILNKTVTEGYERLAKKTPKLFGSLYKSTNKDNHLNSFINNFMSLVSKSILPLINKFNPDIIVTTHPFVTEMISSLKEHDKINKPLLCIMTDYAPHQTWINKYVDSYVVASEYMMEQMVKLGVNRDIIHPFGIPVDSKFYISQDKQTILKELGLKNNIPTLLIMAGSFGVTNILKIYKNINKIDLDFQIIIITGKNQHLYEEFDKIINKNSYTSNSSPQNNKTTKLLYFTNEVHKYMHISDLIITKPGGLTTSEALACNLPMAIFDAIPGQEEENAQFLISNNMAVKLEKDSNCAETIKKLLSNQQLLESMKNSCMSFDKSRSKENILSEIKRLINTYTKQ